MARLARFALAPLELAYRAIARARNTLFDVGVLRATPPAIPAISIGNLSVGGTGKTPIAAFVVAELLKRGAQPCIVLRGYGGDEELVHAQLAPGVSVFAGKDRLNSIAKAAANSDLVVLDDAFQHRRVRRVVDVVLISADAPWSGRCLPAGPLREPPNSLRRASLVVFTCKAASLETAQGLAKRLAPLYKGPYAIARLLPSELTNAKTGKKTALGALSGKRVLLIAGIGDPVALRRQVEGHGAMVVPAFFRDHHDYSDAEARALAERASEVGMALCTLKDAVKLARKWPDKAPALMYLSQRVEVVKGESHLTAALDGLLAARTQYSSRPQPANVRP